MVNILVTATLGPKTPDLKHAAIAVAFLLDTDISDHVLDSLMEAVTTKALGQFEGLITKLSSTADFLTANNAKCTESTLMLKAMFETLGASATPTQALIAKASVGLPVTPAPQGTAAANTLLPDKLTYIMAPEDHSTTGTSKFHNTLNKTLKTLHKKGVTIREVENGKIDLNISKMHTIGLKLVGKSAYLTEFDTAGSAARFCHYAMMEWTNSNKIFGKCMDIIDKAYNVIARFVLCNSTVEPDDHICLCTIELENGLAADYIALAM
ncbi:hypothetical protein C0989_001043 [Termitomyces sp. Mn162]|nr:hypothetical protein C0989_001043 [Termitomyces sp. Mn162]